MVNPNRMRVVERVQRELVAHQFNKDTKDDIFTVLSWYRCHKFPDFDEDGVPILKIVTSESSPEEIIITYGDWVILDNTTDTVVEVLSDEEFQSKYVSVEKINVQGNGFGDISIIPC